MNRHPLDPISLIFGGLFAGLGLFLVSSDAHWESANGAWMLPAVLIVMGGAILWSTASRLRASSGVAEEQEDGEIQPEDYEDLTPMP